MASPKGRTKAPKRRQTDTGNAGVEPGVRTFTTWTPALLKSTEIAAEQGNLRQVANLCDWLLSDERVKGTLDTRVQALLGLTPTFEANGDGRRSKSVVKALEGQDDWTASYPESELALMLTWGILLGCAPMRHEPTRPEEGHGGRWLPCPKFWHPQHLRRDERERVWKIRVEQTNGFVTEETLTPGDGEWLFHQPYGSHRPQMLGLWRGLSRWVLLKYLAMGDIANASAKGSTLAASSETDIRRPEAIGVSNEKQRAQLARDIYERGRDGVVVLPPGYSLELIQATANTESIYVKQIELANEAIAISVRGGNLTTETKGGSLAAIESQERLGDRAKLDWDGESLTTTVHDQSLAPAWALWNFGSSALAPWPVYPTKPKKSSTDKAKATKEATDAAEGLMALGLEIEAQAFIDEWELNGWVKPAPGQKLLLLPASPNPAGPPPGKGMSGPTKPGQEPPVETETKPDPKEVEDDPKETPEAAE